MIGSDVRECNVNQKGACSTCSREIACHTNDRGDCVPFGYKYWHPKGVPDQYIYFAPIGNHPGDRWFIDYAKILMDEKISGGEKTP